MDKTKSRILLAVLAWLGIDSALDQQNRSVAVIDNATREPVFILHHRFAILSLEDLLRRRLPFLKPRKEPEAEELTIDAEELTIDSPVLADDEEGEVPGPEEIREAFVRYEQHIEAMADRAKTDDPRSERLLANQREIARAVGVDLSDDAVWRGALLLAYAVTSTSQTMARRHIMWPPPFVLSDGAVAAFCRTRQSLKAEGDLPDLDFVLPEDDGPDGDSWDDGHD